MNEELIALTPDTVKRLFDSLPSALPDLEFRYWISTIHLPKFIELERSNRKEVQALGAKYLIPMVEDSNIPGGFVAMVTYGTRDKLTGKRSIAEVALVDLR